MLEGKGLMDLTQYFNVIRFRRMKGQGYEVLIGKINTRRGQI
jgi:hypothetical protein